MPIYAYRCAACGHTKDVLRKLSDPPLAACPACGAEAFEKQLTAAGFQLKGSGWYATDFKNAGAKPAPADAAAAGDKAAPATAGEGGETAAKPGTAPADGAKAAAPGESKKATPAAPAPASSPAAAAPGSPA